MKSKIASAEIAYQEIAFEQNSWCKKQLEIVIFNVLAFDWEDSQRSRGTWGIGVGPKKANEGPEGNRWGSRGTLVSWGRLNGSKLDLNIIILSWVHNYMIWFWEYLWKSMKSMKSMTNDISDWFLETYISNISKNQWDIFIVRTWYLQKSMRQKFRQIYLRSPKINEILMYVSCISLIDFWRHILYVSHWFYDVWT